ncbi:MAG: hypothetical protein AABO58_21390 [Acidobacteriota bacterium]
MRTVKAKHHGPDLSDLSETQVRFYRTALRKYREGTEFLAFWNFAFGFGSPLYDGVRTRSEVMGTPLEEALRHMWLDLGIKQGMVAPEKPKRAPRRK